MPPREAVEVQLVACHGVWVSERSGEGKGILEEEEQQSRAKGASAGRGAPS